MQDSSKDPTRISVVDLERLRAIEEEFSDATALGIITVDARGMPVTQQCGFSEFCLEVRKDPIRRMRCYSCDAHGGLQAAIEGRPHIYRCHTGLVDFSVPIVIDDEYVGAILCGQVRVSDGEDPEFLMSPSSWNNDDHLDNLYQEVHRTTLRKIEAAAGILLNLSEEMVHRATSSIVLPLTADLSGLGGPRLLASSANVPQGLSTVAPMEVPETLPVARTPIRSTVHSPATMAQSLISLRRSIQHEDLPNAVAAVSLYLDQLFNESGRFIGADQLNSLHEELLSLAQSYRPDARKAVAESIHRYHRRFRGPVNRFESQVHIDSILYVFHDTALRLEPNRRHTMFSLLNLLERNPARAWTLQDIAHYLGVSPSHASKVFKSHIGLNFVTYVSNKRIDRAKLMIAHTDQPIVRIARTLGFIPNYFSRVFKTHTGMSPSEYRDQYWST